LGNIKSQIPKKNIAKKEPDAGAKIQRPHQNELSNKIQSIQNKHSRENRIFLSMATPVTKEYPAPAIPPQRSRHCEARFSNAAIAHPEKQILRQPVKTLRIHKPPNPT